MFFVHPQIKLKRQNIKSVFFSFFKSPNLNFLEEKLSHYFPDKKIVFTDMARSAFKIVIEKLNLESSEILFPAYICDVFYPILKRYKIQPIFLDADIGTFNIKENQILEKITPRTKAILVCHTFGLPVDIKKIREMTGDKLLIIEDCAHSFFAELEGISTGNFGEAAFFSIYKQFPTFRGGLLISPKNWEINLSKTNFDFRDFISFLNSFSLFSFLFKMFGENIAPKMIRKEKIPEPAGINSVSLNYFSYFLENFESSIKNRIEIGLFFQEELKKLGFEVQESKNPAPYRTGSSDSSAGNVFCYLSALVPKNLKEKRNQIIRELRRYRIFCTRIWKSPIILNPEVQEEYKINLKEFPNTIELSERIINFPLQNDYGKKDIEKMILGIKKVLSNLR